MASAMFLSCALLCSLLAEALRDSASESLALDSVPEGRAEGETEPCAKEANETKRVLRELGYSGEPRESQVIWYADNGCVHRIVCSECAGRLPERIHLQHLDTVELTSPKLTGNIRAFEGLKELQRLNLKNTQVEGDIGVFASTPRLLNLYLQGTQVKGDLEVFRKTPELESLGLEHTHVVGDIQALEATTRLTQLWLHTTSVWGSVKALRSTPRLQWLYLGKTKVHGDLRALGDLRSLFELDLAHTDLVGDLEQLPKAHRLEILKLRGTRVSGNLSTLLRWPRLKKVDLSSTGVRGGVTEAWRGRLRILQVLKLAKSSVRFVPRGDELAKLKQVWEDEDHALLKELKSLDVSGCPLNCTVSDFLMPLAIARITTIKAARAGLQGQVHALTHVGGVTIYASEDFSYESDDETFPLANSLLLLDLTGNNVTHMPRLPLAPGSRRFLLRDIDKLHLGPTVLSQALKEGTILDLSGTTVVNKDEAKRLLQEDVLKITDDHAFRDTHGGFVCKNLLGFNIFVTPSKFLPDQLCQCMAGRYGRGAACQTCPANTFSKRLGQRDCTKCPANSTAKQGSSKPGDCRCAYGRLHNGTCGCDLHHALQGSDCIPCTRLRLQCNQTGSAAATAPPEVQHARLEAKAEVAHRCLPPNASSRCPGSNQCGLGYNGTLCSSCADGFWAARGLCWPCASAASPTSAWSLVALGIAALVAAILLGYRMMYSAPTSQPPRVKSLLQKLLALQGPVLLQMAQLWGVLSRLGRRGSREGLREIPYMEALQLTATEVQNSLNLQCSFDAEMVRTMTALSSPLTPLLLLICCSALEYFRAGLGVNMALRTLTLLFIGGASSTAELLSCQAEDGDGESLEDFAFRKAFRHLRCSDHDGVAFWIDAVGCGCAVAYGVLIPLLLAGLMMKQYFALREARLCYAHVEEEPRRTTLQINTLRGQLAKEVLPGRLLAAAAAHLAVHCRGRRHVQLQEEYVIITSEGPVEKAEELDAMKLVADDDTSRDLDTLRSRKIAEMLTERTMVAESSDRWLQGAQPLLFKYAVAQDIWTDVLMKLYAVALVSCVSMMDAWKWAVAFSLGVAVLVGVYQPYMQPQVSHLQSLSCFALAVTSVAFVYDLRWLARVALLSPVVLLLWQARCPDCTEALAERIYQELQAELPKLQRLEAHEVHVQLLRL